MERPLDQTRMGKIWCCLLEARVRGLTDFSGTMQLLMRQLHLLQDSISPVPKPNLSISAKRSALLVECHRSFWRGYLSSSGARITTALASNSRALFHGYSSVMYAAIGVNVHLK